MNVLIPVNISRALSFWDSNSLVFRIAGGGREKEQVRTSVGVSLLLLVCWFFKSSEIVNVLHALHSLWQPSRGGKTINSSSSHWAMSVCLELSAFFSHTVQPSLLLCEETDVFMNLKIKGIMGHVQCSFLEFFY